jgi:hypothetical protein
LRAIAEAFVELLAALAELLWAPPERLIRRVWARFKHRSAPMRALGAALCAVMAVASFVLVVAVAVAVVVIPIALLIALL